MKKIFLVLLPPLLLCTAAGITWYLRTGKPAPEMIVAPVSKPVVEVQRATFSKVSLNIHSQGIVTPYTSTDLVSPVSGRVLFVNPKLRPGGFFKKGEELVRIDSTRYEAAVADTAANVARAELNLEQIEAVAGQAKRDWQRLGKGKANRLALHEPQLQEARAQLRAAKAAHRLAFRELADTTLTAPYDCRVKSVSVSEGRHLDLSEQVASIFSTAAAEIRLPVRSCELDHLEGEVFNYGVDRDQLPEVVLSAEVLGRSNRRAAEIVRTEGTVDPATRMTYLVARIEDPYDRSGNGAAVLPIGLHVQAEIRGRTVDGVVRLPLRALAGEKSIIVVDDTGRIHRREVTLLARDGDEVYVSGGLSQGELVCTSRVDYLVDGRQVIIADELLLAGGGHD